MRSACGSKCTIVALDVLDQRGVERYIGRFFKALPRSYRSRKIVIGIHNYSDTNRLRSSGTSSIIRTVRRYDRHAKFWLTETGGVVNFGRSFPCNTKRAASRTSYMFTLAKKYDRYVERLYSYNFFGIANGTECGLRCPFDGGLVDPYGSPRPGDRRIQAQGRRLLALKWRRADALCGRQRARRRVGQRQQRAEARDLQHALDLMRSAPDRQRRAGLLGPLGWPARACAGPVESMNVSSRRSSTSSATGSDVASRDRLLELRRRGDVQLPARRDVHPAVRRERRCRSKGGIGHRRCPQLARSPGANRLQPRRVARDEAAGAGACRPASASPSCGCRSCRSALRRRPGRRGRGWSRP